MPETHLIVDAALCRQSVYVFLSATEQAARPRKERIPGIIGAGVDVYHFFHARGELGIACRWDHPIFDLPSRHAFF
jgi:hypothetical protein